MYIAALKEHLDKGVPLCVPCTRAHVCCVVCLRALRRANFESHYERVGHMRVSLILFTRSVRILLRFHLRNNSTHLLLLSRHIHVIPPSPHIDRLSQIMSTPSAIMPCCSAMVRLFSLVCVSEGVHVHSCGEQGQQQHI